MRIPPVIRMFIMNLTGRDDKAPPINGAEAERAFFRFLLHLLSFYLYRDNGMPGILVPCVKQIVGYFVCQIEVLDGLTLRHRLRFVTDKQIVDCAIILILDYANKFALHLLNRIIQNRCCYTCLPSF